MIPPKFNIPPSPNWNVRYDKTSGEGEYPEIETAILGKIFDTVIQVTDKYRQIRGVDYEVTKNTFPNRRFYVDVKSDHYASVNDFVYEIVDKNKHSWTENDNFHLTDIFVYIKYSEGIAYFISRKELLKFTQTEIFRHRSPHYMGEYAIGKFFRLDSELPADEIIKVKFDVPQYISANLKKPMPDEIKFHNI